MPAYYDEKRHSWYCKFYYKDYTGQRKQKCKRGFPRKADALAFEREFLLNMANSPDITFETLRTSYIDFCSTRLKDTTLRTKISIIDNNIAPYFDRCQINQISPIDVSRWQDQMKAKGLKSTSLRQIHGQLAAIFNFAVKYKGLLRNPCIETMGTTARKPESIDFWTLDEYREFISHVPAIEYRTIYELLYYSGMRIGELLALTLSDIDFEHNIIKVHKNLDYTNKKKNHITTPKSVNSTRNIALPEKVSEDLLEYTRHIYDLTSDNALFFLSYNSISAYKNSVCRRNNIRQIRIHDFRHSHVSLLVDMGIDMLLIADRIGDDVQTVQHTYAHLYPNKNMTVADKLNQLVSP